MKNYLSIITQFRRSICITLLANAFLAGLSVELTLAGYSPNQFRSITAVTDKAVIAVTASTSLYLPPSNLLFVINAPQISQAVVMRGDRRIKDY